MVQERGELSLEQARKYSTLLRPYNCEDEQGAGSRSSGHISQANSVNGRPGGSEDMRRFATDRDWRHIPGFLRGL